MEIKIEEFKSGETIPRKHTCDGKDSIPTIRIKEVPKKTESLAFVIDDPDATDGDVWDHCVLYNIAPETEEIHAKNIDSFQSGVNSWDKEGYGGPCPPKGSEPHRYRFTVYALEKNLEFKKPPNSEKLMQEMKKYILKEATYTGLFGRK